MQWLYLNLNSYIFIVNSWVSRSKYIISLYQLWTSQPLTSRFHAKIHRCEWIIWIHYWKPTRIQYRGFMPICSQVEFTEKWENDIAVGWVTWLLYLIYILQGWIYSWIQLYEFICITLWDKTLFHVWIAQVLRSSTIQST